MKRAKDDRLPAKVLPLRRVAGKPSEMTDAALLAGCAVEDPATLGALYDRYSDAVYKFLLHLSGHDGDEIDDLVATTFLEACRAAGRFRGESTTRSWLFGIGINVYRHHVRSAVRRRALLTSYKRQPKAERAMRPDDTVENREIVSRVGEAISRLPMELRETFVLSELEGLSGPEVARALDVPEGTIWRRLHDARKILRGVFS